ncbi:hypothetical protein KGD83_15150 [Nocardiopsis akebiae]|uniref:Uncharacterized protein n=1 Tax=Nocardiopsis akebiae TaxID=2831968 RepID=A0ABX8BYF3_9ACTN|nr:hypothetical protein [Nocardiopsis akebiae]QUX26725.1 hypothetical protein KGD83_15150 [Nocardiopsis akebiae]
MNAELLRDVAERVRLVPDRHRVFNQGTPTVLKVFGIGAPVLSDLLDLGLPHRSSGGERYFDKLDLENVSLSLGLPSPRYLAMRRWPEVLRAVVERRPVRYDLEVVAECDPEAPVHVCDFRLPAEVLALGTETDPAVRRLTLSREVGATGRPGEAPRELQRIFSEVSGFRFHILPEALYGDLAFVAETSLADCELATRYLARRAAEEGWEARRSFGLLLSSPYSLPHYWPEIRLDGVWTAFDPHLVNSLVRWGVLAPSAVSSAQVLNSVFFRVAEDWMPLVQDAGRPARVSVLTRRRALTDGAASTDQPVKETADD